MDILKTILIAIVQGLTEFLPVSSSGHLVLAERLLNVKQPGLILEVALHLGTVFAVLAVYWRDIGSIVSGFLNLLARRDWRDNANGRFACAIIVASVPTALMGLLLKQYIEGMFESLLVVGIGLTVTAALLWLTRIRGKTTSALGEIGFLRAVLIGISQGLAITPGISRSGATISCGLLLGVEREHAARFSFILSIPAILGATALELRHAAGNGVQWTPILIGTAVSFAVGYFALRILLRFVKRGKLHVFSYYCLAVGLLTILAWAFLPH